MSKTTIPHGIPVLVAIKFTASVGNFVGPLMTMLLTIKFGFREETAGYFLSTMTVISAGGMILGGKIGDHFGRKKSIIFLLIMSGIAYLVCFISGFTPYVPYLLGTAVFFSSGLWPVINAFAADLTDETNRKQSFSLMYWANNVGFSIGPALAGFLFAKASRILFAGNLLAVIFCIILISTQKEPVHHMTEASKQKTKNKSTFSFFLADPVLMFFCVASFILAFVYRQYEFALPIMMVRLFGETQGPQYFGILLMVNGLTVVVLTWLVTRLSKKMQALSCLAFACIFYAFGFAGYAFFQTLFMLAFLTFFWTIGEILAATNSNAFVAERAAITHRSRINSAVSLVYTAGNAAAPLFGGLLLAAFGIRVFWNIIGIFSLAGLVIYLVAEKKQKSSRHL